MQSPIELKIDSLPLAENPWRQDWYVELSGPDATVMKIPGFYDGKDYKFRVSPQQTGDWNYRVLLDGKVLGEGNFTHTGGEDLLKGGLSIDPRNPRRFAYKDGSSCFLISYESNWLFALEQAFPGQGRTLAFLKHIQDSGFNCVLMNLYAHDTSWCPGKTEAADFGPPPHSPWEGGNDNPDFSKPNAAFWEAMDQTVAAFQEAGLFLHLYFKVYNKMVNWPEAGSADEEHFFRHAVARYQAYSCMIWDFAKETYYEPDKALVKRRMRQIGEWDAHMRPRTLHDDLILYADKEAEEYLEFQSIQQHHDFHASALLEAGRHAWPLVNVEFGYECGPGGLSDVGYGVGQTPQELIRRAWIVACSGAYPAYYYTYTAWDIIHEKAHPAGYGFWKILADFFHQIDFESFRPAPELLLWRSSFAMVKGDPADPEEMICFVDWHILTPPQLIADKYTGEWLNIYSGERRLIEGTVTACVDRPEYTIYTIPFNTPHATLHLVKK